MRIISLVPSITKSIIDVGLGNNDLVGRTKFCIHPAEKVKNIPVIGGTKNINLEKIESLKPDLIIANKEENEKLQVEKLAENYRVWVTDIKTLRDNENFLWELGMVLKQRTVAEEFKNQIKEIFSNINLNPTPPNVAYLIWQKPYMTVGGDTFINEILKNLGFNNIFSEQKRYPEVSLDQLKIADYLFLSSEPFPFNEKHIEDLQKELPHLKIILVDGEAFSWFGTPIAAYKKYYQNLIDSI